LPEPSRRTSRLTRTHGRSAFFFGAALAAALLAGCWIAPAAFARPAASPDLPPDLAAKYDQVTNEILCWCGCARQSLRECSCGFSHDVRTQIETDLKAGKTPEELIAGFIEKQGDQVRIVPEAKGFDRLAWIGPGIAIVLGAVLMLVALRRWTTPAPPAPHPVPSPADEALDDEYRARLARSLQRMDS
jgi:cytochrome c-type biogenesis protein CcmH/NrfF